MINKEEKELNTICKKTKKFLKLKFNLEKYFNKLPEYPSREIDKELTTSILKNRWGTKIKFKDSDCYFNFGNIFDNIIANGELDRRSELFIPEHIYEGLCFKHEKFDFLEKRIETYIDSDNNVFFIPRVFVLRKHQIERDGVLKYLEDKELLEGFGEMTEWMFISNSVSKYTQNRRSQNYLVSALNIPLKKLIDKKYILTFKYPQDCKDYLKSLKENNIQINYHWTFSHY